jgi:DNA-directed RNA polymerase subunit RPC12/RpoP
VVCVGDSKCGNCGLKFRIEIEEPRCARCGYLLWQLTERRCPECGQTF